MTASEPPDTPEGRRSGTGLYLPASGGDPEFGRFALFSDAVSPSPSPC
jgi:hypothetical protein